MPRTSLTLLLAAGALGAPLPGRALAASPVRELPGARGPIRNVCFSPDGKFVAAGVFADEVRVWEVASGKLVHLLAGGAGPSIAAAFAPDGKSIVTTAWHNGTLSVWELPTGKKRLTLPRDPGPAVHHVAFSPDGKRIASTGSELRVWDAASGKLVYSRSNRGGGCTVAFSPDGRRLAATDHAGGVALWEVSTGRQVRRWAPGGVVAGLAFSRDGSRLYCGGNDGQLREFDADGKALRRWTTAGQGVARTLSISPDGHSLAVSTERGVVQVWELATLKQRRAFAADRGFAWAVAFAPDGKSIATAGDEGVVRLWDITGGWAEPRAAKKKPLTEEQLEAYWKALGGEADAAFTAVWALAAHGKQSVPFLSRKLKVTRRPLSAKQIARLVGQLGADDFEARERASEELARGGATVRTALEAAAKGRLSLEQKRRVAEVLARLRDVGLGADEVLLLRTAEVLSKIDSAEARELLGTLPR
jgi:DNA-binding beta-propeller fold protein YncE